MSQVEIRYRGPSSTLVAAGHEVDGVVVYGWGFEQECAVVDQVSYVLVDEGFVISQPRTFGPQLRGWWYCQLVDIARDASSLTIDDLSVAVLVGPPEQAYQVLDVDAFAASLAAGRMSAARAADGLGRLHTFLERRLNRLDPGESPWPDFPPTALESLSPPSPFAHEWRWLSSATNATQ